MAFLRYGDEYLKVVFDLNKKVGKGRANLFQTAGKILAYNLKEEDGYIEIK